MATATFPAVFNFMTLRDYSKSEDQYVHVFDGGNFDNLGLTSVLRLVAGAEISKQGKIIVVLVDSHTGGSGVSGTKPDGRNITDFVVDTNFLDATDSLLVENRRSKLRWFESRFHDLILGKLNSVNQAIFYHIEFDDVSDKKLRADLKSISTNFEIGDAETELIERGVRDIMKPQNPCLVAIKGLLSGIPHDRNINCP